MPGLILGTGELDVDLLGPVAIGSATYSLTANANAQVTNSVTANASLGSISANANSVVVMSASGNANLGEIIATAISEVENLVVASALLGEVTASAAAVRTTFATATSSFGSLVAEANTIPTPPTPPTPEITISQSGLPSYVQPNFPQVELPEVKPALAQVMAQASLKGIKANAISRIDFSIIEDDNEVLLLI